jgi:hypothetical protein
MARQPMSYHPHLRLQTADERKVSFGYEENVHDFSSLRALRPDGNPQTRTVFEA